jgi:hypothetical protein
MVREGARWENDYLGEIEVMPFHKTIHIEVHMLGKGSGKRMDTNIRTSCSVCRPIEEARTQTQMQGEGSRG